MKFRVSLVILGNDSTIVEQVESPSIVMVDQYVISKYIPITTIPEIKIHAHTKTWHTIKNGDKNLLEVIEVEKFSSEYSSIVVNPCHLFLKVAEPEIAAPSFKGLKSGYPNYAKGLKFEVKDTPFPAAKSGKPTHPGYMDGVEKVNSPPVAVGTGSKADSKVFDSPKEAIDFVVKGLKSEVLEDGTHTKATPKIDADYIRVCEEWGVNPYLKLSEWAADFYTLYYLTLDHPDVKEMFEEYKEILLVQFVNYVDMALGGELRHASHRATGISKVRGLSPLHNKIIGAMIGSDASGRQNAWRKWRIIRDEHGLEALIVAEDAFKKMSWSGAYGGKKWGTAAEILHHYLDNNITATAYIDTIWSLQHNCNYILDKVWQLDSSLKFILDCKVEDKIQPITKYCTKEVKALWNTKNSV